MSVIIHPLVGISGPFGFLEFGMTREEVREEVGTSMERRLLNTDNYDIFGPAPGLHVQYDKDGICERFILNEVSNPVLLDQHIYEYHYDQMLEFIRSVDGNVRVDDGGFLAPSLGVGITQADLSFPFIGDVEVLADHMF